MAYIVFQRGEEPVETDLDGLLKLAVGAGLQNVELMRRQLQVVAEAESDAAASRREDVLVPAALGAGLAGMTIHSILAREAGASVTSFANRNDLESAMGYFNGQ